MEGFEGVEGLFSFLLFAGVFYLMMRYGCGAHLIHGHGHRHGKARSTDPVCGMEVQAGRGYSKMHQGKEYRFCSRSCLDKFDAEPERFLTRKGAAP